MKLYDYDQKLIMQSTLGRNMTFKVDIEITDIECLIATNVVRESELWHKRLVKVQETQERGGGVELGFRI